MVPSHQEENIEVLGESAKSHVFHCSVSPKMLLSSGPFDMVFLDPPYDSDLLLIACDYLQKNKELLQGALVFIEVPRRFDFTTLPASWENIKFKQSKRSAYGLWRTL
jgi:16S rRNA (guanine966-N2)-methyltransferase